jgi:multidrug efflux pump subunit AcrB
MNSEHIAIEVNDILSDENHIRMDSKDSQVTHTTLEKDSNNFYVLTIGDEGFDRHKLTEEASEVLLSAHGEIENWVASDSTSEVSEPRIHLFNDRDKKMFVSVSFIFNSNNSQLFDQYASLFEKNDKTHDVSVQDIVEIEIRDSFTRQGITDATCYYKTHKPHELYANIDTMGAFADMVSENSEKSKDEILDMEKYTVHYHPENRDTIQDMTSDVLSMYRKDVSYPDFSELSLEETSIKTESAEVAVGIYTPVQILADKS